MLYVFYNNLINHVYKDDSLPRDFLYYWLHLGKGRIIIVHW